MSGVLPPQLYFPLHNFKVVKTGEIGALQNGNPCHQNPLSGIKQGKL